jgi:transposase
MGTRGPKPATAPTIASRHAPCRRGASNEELAGLLGVSRNTITNWIRFHGRHRGGRAGAKVAPGPRTGYSRYCEQARCACKLRATNKELAGAANRRDAPVSCAPRIRNWPAFSA